MATTVLDSLAKGLGSVSSPKNVFSSASTPKNLAHKGSSIFTFPSIKQAIAFSSTAAQTTQTDGSPASKYPSPGLCKRASLVTHCTNLLKTPPETMLLSPDSGLPFSSYSGSTPKPPDPASPYTEYHSGQTPVASSQSSPASAEAKPMTSPFVSYAQISTGNVPKIYPNWSNSTTARPLLSTSSPRGEDLSSPTSSAGRPSFQWEEIPLPEPEETDFQEYNPAGSPLPQYQMKRTSAIDTTVPYSPKAEEETPAHSTLDAVNSLAACRLGSRRTLSVETGRPSMIDNGGIFTGLYRPYDSKSSQSPSQPK